MIYGNRTNSSLARLCQVIVLFLPLNSEAAAPVYFDLGTLFLYGALYLLGLVVFPFIIGFTKDKALKKFWSWSFAVFVIGPAAYIFVEARINSLHNARFMNEVKVGEQRNLEAFATYCKGRTPIVHSRALQQNAVSLAVRIEKNFTGVHWEFNADPLFEYLGKNRDLCARTGVAVLEGVYNGAYLKEKKGYEKEVHRYHVCTKDKSAVVPEIQSRYELVLGQTGHKDPVPWGGEDGRWMSNSSIQIVDRSTGNVLAEDTMYFLRYATGEGGCPAGLEQLSDLLIKVFGRQ